MMFCSNKIHQWTISAFALTASIVLGACGTKGESFSITNQTQQEWWVEATIDGKAMGFGACGIGGTGDMFVASSRPHRMAHFHIRELGGNKMITEVDVDLTRVPGDGDDLFFEIKSTTEVTARYRNKLTQ